MKVGYSFSVLRYVHDAVTQEFVNVGVAVYSPEAGYLRARCTTNYARMTHMFHKIDGPYFREAARYIEAQICALGQQYESALPFDVAPSIEQLLARVLPPDDSALQFSKPGVGLSADLDQTLQQLYQRHVEQYTSAGESPRRTDDDVWRVFREPLDRALVTPRLKPKRIVAPNYDYEFERAWRNETWHVYEPVSFDLVEAASMLDKANRWVGRATSLLDSADAFCIYLLLGEPVDERLRGTFVKARNILNQMPGRREFILESEAEAFAQELARELVRHWEEQPVK